MTYASAAVIDISLTPDCSDFVKNVKKYTKWNMAELKVSHGTGKISHGITRAGCTVDAKAL